MTVIYRAIATTSQLFKKLVSGNNLRAAMSKELILAKGVRVLHVWQRP